MAFLTSPIISPLFTYWPWVLLLLGTLVCFTTCVYRITLHPLARFPGPFFSKITDWSIVFQAASGERHINSWKEHQKYGPIVRIGPNTLSFNTTSALKTIYADRNANVKKSAWYLTIDAGSKAFSLNSEIDKSKHAFRRRIAAHAFSDAALRAQEGFVGENVKAWCDALGPGTDCENKWSMPRDMNDWANWLAYDVMGDLTFGKSFDCIKHEGHRHVPRLMLEATKFVYVAGFLPIISLVRPLIASPLLSYVFVQSAKDLDAFVEYANVQMENRIAAENIPEQRPRKDFMHYLINANDSDTGRGLTPDELNADSSLLISAGSDTTALTITAAFFYLLHNPPALAKLTTDLRKVFPDESAIVSGGNQIMTLVPYLRAVIDETLRMAPPVACHLPREVMAGGIEIDGHYVPEGMVVGVCRWAIHHEPAYWPEPFTWDPERWLEGTCQKLTDDRFGGTGVEASETFGKPADAQKLSRTNNTDAFCAFSHGPRGCIGKKVGYLESSLALALALWKYDVRSSEIGVPKVDHAKAHAYYYHKTDIRSLDSVYQLWDYFVADRRGPIIQFRPHID